MPSSSYSDSELVTLVEEFFFSEGLTTILENFAASHVGAIDASLAEGE